MLEAPFLLCACALILKFPPSVSILACNLYCNAAVELGLCKYSNETPDMLASVLLSPFE